MPLTYRRPGVYLEESLLSNAGDVSNATSVAVFIGAASKGPLTTDANANVVGAPTRIETWGDYVATFGGFDTVPNGANTWALSYLPYSVYAYFQNGGRTAFVARAVATLAAGTASAKIVTGKDFATNLVTQDAFTITARSVGTWGQNLSYTLGYQTTDIATDQVFTLQVLLTTGAVTEVVETYRDLSMSGSISGTRAVADAVNDLSTGSRYIQISAVDNTTKPAEATTAVALTGGTDPDVPTQSDLITTAEYAVGQVEGPVLVNIVGFVDDVNAVDTSTWADAYVGGTISSTAWSDRQDVFVVNDTCVPRIAGQSASSYVTEMQTSSALGANNGDSYTASYGPWVLINNPLKSGSILAVPPGGAVMGTMARIDATVGVFRAPAGVIAGLNNVVGVQTKFTDTELGTLNSANINIIRPVVGAGIAIMGARTRKSYGADRYVSARRTLIYIREVMRRSTQYAVFENNDSRLWASLRMTAERLLRPLWEAGGLRGANASDAYFIRCDDTVNTQSVIASGEVRMEVGVALEYPAEFVVIRVSQYDRSQSVNEITTTN